MDLVGSEIEGVKAKKYNIVSILLSQWIWLEALDWSPIWTSFSSFNPSESMDLVGSEGHCQLERGSVLFQSFWVNGFGWKTWGCNSISSQKRCFNPSESMDLVGRIFPIWQVRPWLGVSILLSQWIWLEVEIARLRVEMLNSFNPSESMDLVGSSIRWSKQQNLPQFQSFWVNGFGWKKRFGEASILRLQVSILLSQWIWLEEKPPKSWLGPFVSFNPSESMDLVGRRVEATVTLRQGVFQSFWVNGFGWKKIKGSGTLCISTVSILLSQWIWLEDGLAWDNSGGKPVSILLSQWIWLEDNCSYQHYAVRACFNPSESMDLVGSGQSETSSIAFSSFQSFWVNGFGWKQDSENLGRKPLGVSILLSQWIWLEDLPAALLNAPYSGFNPSESMDLVGRFFLFPCLIIRSKFQSFWVNGFGWKLSGLKIPHLRLAVSILLSQWIWLEEIGYREGRIYT